MNDARPTRLIVGITGATGTIFGVRLLQMLHGSGVETHMVLSKWAARTLVHETDYSIEQVQNLAAHNYSLGDSGCGNFQRFVRDAGHGHRAVQHEDSGRD